MQKNILSFLSLERGRLVNRFRLATLVAFIAVLLGVGLRAYFFTQAGALWRDEANSVSLAQLPSFAQFFSQLEYDSFPLLWFLILRAWVDLGPEGSDLWIRVLGLLMSLLIFPTTWWAARQFSVRPLATGLLAGVAPAFVIWAGVANRGYGLGVALLALMFGMVWRVYSIPTRRNFLIALGVAILAIHTLYYNCLMLFVLLVAAGMVALIRRRWWVASILGVLGLVAAATMLVYLPILQSARRWSGLLYSAVGLDSLDGRFQASLAEGGGFVYPLAVGLLTAMVVFWLHTIVQRWRDDQPADASGELTFAVVAATLAIVVQTLFLLRLQYDTQPWYFVTATLVAALSIDVVLQKAGGRIVQLAVPIILAVAIVASSVQTVSAVSRRQTNVDRVAKFLSANAKQDDLIVINPWYFGITFQRYYTGKAPYVGVPDVGFFGYHKYDLVKSVMLHPERVEITLDRVSQTLLRGSRVWVVGGLPEAGASITPLPQPEEGNPMSWNEAHFTNAVARQMAYIVVTRASFFAEVRLPTERTSGFERARLFVASAAPR